MTMLNAILFVVVGTLVGMLIGYFLDDKRSPQDHMMVAIQAAVIFFALQYFFGWGAPPSTGQDLSFVPPSYVTEQDIDFSDAPAGRPSKEETINLPYGTMQFNNDGGVLVAQGFIRESAGAPELVTTLTPSQSKEAGTFLVAFDGLGATPFFYDMSHKEEHTDRTSLTYVGESALARVKKIFTLHHGQTLIDLALTIEPKTDAPLSPRLLFSAPHVTQDGQDKVFGVTTSGESLVQTSVDKLKRVGIERPTIFGFEDTYFAFVLLKDPDSFAQSAYFDTTGSKAQAVLQHMRVSEPKTWHMSFYAGPKEMKALNAVDSRLEGLLAYGWLAPIARLLLQVLIWLYDLVGNYGLAIILLTVLVRILLLPFALQAGDPRKLAAERSKKMQYLERKYKDDKEELQRQQMKLLSEQGLPGGMSMFLQIPIFFGLQRVLRNAIELYKAPFLWIPDLSAPDPYYILPLISGAVLVVQFSQGGSIRTYVLSLIGGLFMAALLSNWSAGLALYIVVSTFLAIVQSHIQARFS